MLPRARLQLFRGDVNRGTLLRCGQVEASIVDVAVLHSAAVAMTVPPSVALVRPGRRCWQRSALSKSRAWRARARQQLIGSNGTALNRHRPGI